METLKIKRGETFYLLYNLTNQSVREFQSDPQKLKTYANNCLQSGLNICVLENEGNSETLTANPMSFSGASVASASPSTTSVKKKFSFLCANFEGQNYIHGVKFEKHPWHYFDKLDSLVSQHGAIRSSIEHLIGRLNKVRSIDMNLSEEQSKNYFSNSQFVFKNKKLKTQMDLTTDQSENELNKSSHKSVVRSTTLVFVSGETNPLLFLNKFEKCCDLKTDKAKMFKIRDFVDECHKAEFSKLCFTGDWPTVKSAFLKFYALSFVRNKKRELTIDFNEAVSLRSFVEQKMINLSKFTTLPLINQMEIIINDLPAEISSLFITNEKMTCDKAEILDFCESIQDVAETFVEATDEIFNEADGQSNPLNKMEIFNFSREPPSELFEPPSEPCAPQSECESMSVEEAPQSSRGRGRGRGRGKGRGKSVSTGGVSKRGRPPKIFKPILEDSSEYDFLRQVDDSSRSTCSSAL